MKWDEDISLPEARQGLFVQIVRLTDAFCAEYLDEEYAEVCQFMTADLCELQPSPLDKGRVPTWAAGIVFTVGSINFLNDPGFDPYLSTAELARLLQVSEGTLYNKRRQIEKALRAMPFDPNYTVTSMMDVNPFVWMVEMDGFPMDIRDAPREMQIEAYEQGLIPYLPPSPWDEGDDFEEEDEWDDFDEEDEPDLIRPPAKQDRGEVKIIKFPGPADTLKPDSPPTKKKNSKPSLFDE
jgi:hypothetical protein